jgi:hypothetical protein
VNEDEKMDERRLIECDRTKNFFLFFLVLFRSLFFLVLIFFAVFLLLFVYEHVSHKHDQVSDQHDKRLDHVDQKGD